mmetsp:Transcript_19424/g.44656  ORF Transcript_19424/g.44656 Transcript_19424/m.44656 type:complete len:405 (-) Transcript_19424:2188-3402(-)
MGTCLIGTRSSSSSPASGARLNNAAARTCSPDWRYQRAGRMECLRRRRPCSSPNSRACACGCAAKRRAIVRLVSTARRSAARTSDRRARWRRKTPPSSWATPRAAARKAPRALARSRRSGCARRPSRRPRRRRRRLRMRESTRSNTQRVCLPIWSRICMSKIRTWRCWSKMASGVSRRCGRTTSSFCTRSSTSPSSKTGIRTRTYRTRACASVARTRTARGISSTSPRSRSFVTAAARRSCRRRSSASIFRRAPRPWRSMISPRASSCAIPAMALSSLSIAPRARPASQRRCRSSRASCRRGRSARRSSSISLRRRRCHSVRKDRTRPSCRRMSTRGGCSARLATSGTTGCAQCTTTCSTRTTVRSTAARAATRATSPSTATTSPSRSARRPSTMTRGIWRSFR